MEILYISDKVKHQCESLKEAQKLFGGDKQLAKSLLLRISFIKDSDRLSDIIEAPQFHFHRLTNKNGNNLKGFYAIDVKTRREPWRIIFQPLDDNYHLFSDDSIDKIAKTVKIIEISEVSNHYE